MNAIDPHALATLRTPPRPFTPRYDECATVDAAALEPWIAERLYDLAFHLVDRIDVTAARPLPGPHLQRIAARLGAFGYQPVGLAADAVAPQPSLRFAAPRLIEPQVDRFRDAADRAAILARHGVACRGVIQVGAHVGQEVALFKALGARRMILVEANPSVYQTLAQQVRALGVDALLANCAVTDFDGETELMLASFDQSSSLLPLAHHSVEYPGIRAVGAVRVPARRLDTLVAREFNADPGDYNLLEIDVQGAEGLVLRGAPAQLARVDAVFVEINFKAMYEGCLLIDAIDALMLDAGLARVETNNAHSRNWGDALYVRRPRRVAMSTLGSNGRLGNQVFQYAWLKTLCDEHGLEDDAPTGDLPRLFACAPRPRHLASSTPDHATVASEPDPPRAAQAVTPAASKPDHAIVPSEPDPPRAAAVVTPAAAPELPTLSEQALLSLDPFGAQTAAIAQGRDITGWFQFHTSLWQSRRDTFRATFAPNEACRRLEPRISRSFAQRGRAIAIHHRHGDFAQFGGSRVFFIAPLAWYADEIARLARGPAPAFVYVASDGPFDATPLAAAGVPVITADDLLAQWAGERDGVPDGATPLAVDFTALRLADALMISNSTFSFAAAMLNDRSRVFLRPDPDLQRLRPFDPWASEVLLGLEDDPVRFAMT